MKRDVDIGILQSHLGGYRAMGRASLQGGFAAIDRVNADPKMAARLPWMSIRSCNLAECELPLMGDAAKGLIGAGLYFHDPAAWRPCQFDRGGR